MKRLLAGMLVSVFALVGFATPAGAAEIPPTAECTQTFRPLFTEYVKATSDDDSAATAKKAAKKIVGGLADAGCVSDAAPLLKEMPVKPFTQTCVDAAEASRRFWAPTTRQLSSMLRRYNRRSAPLEARIRKLQRKIRKLREGGASKQRIRKIERVRNAVSRRASRLGSSFDRRIFRLIRPHQFQTSLMIYELVSRRCTAGYVLFSEEGEPGPVARVMERHGLTIFISMIGAYESALKGTEKGESTGVSVFGTRRGEDLYSALLP